jgi:hypothetical protein
VKGLGKGVIKGTIEDVDGIEALVSIANGYNSPWLKKISDLFETEDEASEMMYIENSEMISIMDLVSVQPMMGPTPGSISIRYKYATNSTQSNDNQSSATQGVSYSGISGPRQSQEEGDIGGIPGYYQVPTLHL